MFLMKIKGPFIIYPRRPDNGLENLVNLDRNFGKPKH